MSKIQTVHDKVQVQLDAAQQQAHDDNKRNFEEHEQQIFGLFGDIESVVAGLKINLVQCIQSFANVHRADGGPSRKPSGKE